MPFNAKDLFTLLSLARDPKDTKRTKGFRSSTSTGENPLHDRMLSSTDENGSHVPVVMRAPSILSQHLSALLIYVKYLFVI